MIKNFFQRINPYFFVIIVIASILRFTNISLMPPSLNWDEVSHGYNAYSILVTGKDEWGVSYPTIFRAYGDYKLPAYIYLTAVSEKLFGLDEFAVRLPSVLAGIGIVIFTYLLVLELFKNKTLAALSAFLVTVEPWSLFLSRAAFEANLALFFIVSGVFFFIKSVQSTKYLIPSMALLGLSVWTYNSARVFVPILTIALLIIYWKELKVGILKHKKVFSLSLLIFTFFFVPMLIQLLQPVGQARYGKVAILNEGAIAKIEEARNLSKLSPVINRLANNRVVYFSKTFIQNWASHYSASFLFFDGGSDYQFSIPGRGTIYWIDIVPIVIGLLWLIKVKSKTNTLLLSWFFLAPIPSALTSEAPHVLRSIVLLPIPLIIAAIGVWEIGIWLKTKINISPKVFIALYVAIIYLFLENYGIAYATTYRENYSWSWQYGYKQVVDYVKGHYGEYDKIIVTKKYGEPHEFFLFYWPWNPAKYQSDPDSVRFFQSNWYWVDRFDKFYFVNDWQVSDLVTESKVKINCDKSKCLLVTSPGNYPKGWRKLEVVNFLDGKEAFEIYANN